MRAKPSAWVEETLTKVIDGRYCKRRQIVATANCSLEDLVPLVGELGYEE